MHTCVFPSDRLITSSYRNIIGIIDSIKGTGP